MKDDDIEQLRPLLPVGYDAVANAYNAVAGEITAADLTNHYTAGLEYFHDEFTPLLKRRVEELTGGCWRLDDFVAYAAGSDVDLMTHLVEAVAAQGGKNNFPGTLAPSRGEGRVRGQRKDEVVFPTPPRDPVRLFPGDWYGFLVGCTQQHNIAWHTQADGGLACLCVPSVRNGHLTSDMVEFVNSANAALLNLNLFPTLTPEERHSVAIQLQPALPKAILSISFSRGFGMTASQLGVFLIHRDHPYRRRYERQWNWFTYFYNTIAARVFAAIDLHELATVDTRRRAWATHWLTTRNLPATPTGSYYVKTFTLKDPIPQRLTPLERDGRIRLCLKPPQTGVDAMD